MFKSSHCLISSYLIYSDLFSESNLHLFHQAVIENARKATAWKEFAMEASQCRDYADLGRMLLKLQTVSPFILMTLNMRILTIIFVEFLGLYVCNCMPWLWLFLLFNLSIWDPKVQ